MLLCGSLVSLRQVASGPHVERHCLDPCKCRAVFLKAAVADVVTCYLFSDFSIIHCLPTNCQHLHFFARGLYLASGGWLPPSWLKLPEIHTICEQFLLTTDRSGYIAPSPLGWGNSGV